jgi:hypothetical protein
VCAGEAASRIGFSPGEMETDRAFGEAQLVGGAGGGASSGGGHR